jgi:hypothetical protein
VNLSAEAAGARLFHMPKKKLSRRKKPVAKKKSAAKKKTVRKTSRSGASGATRGKTAAKKRRAVKKGSAGGAGEIRSPEGSTLDGRLFTTGSHRPRRGLGAAFAGQSGDLQGLPRTAGVDSESVEELVGEGQAYEAEVISGVENALDPDEGEVRTREIPADDVPREYTDED